MLSYPVIVEVKNLAGTVLERHTVAAGSRIETACGAHCVPAVTHDAVLASRPLPSDLLFLHARPAEPWRAQAIPTRLHRLIDGADPEWGREGTRWPRDCKTSGGGTAIGRAAGYMQMYHWLPAPPLALTSAEIERLRRATSPSSVVLAIHSAEEGQSTFLGDP